MSTHLSKKKKIVFSFAVFSLAAFLFESAVRFADSKLHIAEKVKIRVLRKVPLHEGPYEPLPSQLDDRFEFIRYRPVRKPGAGNVFVDDTKLDKLAPIDLKGRDSVICLGGSALHGAGVRSDQCFTARIQAKLPELQVINAGRNGLNSHGVSLLAKTVLDHYRPGCLLVMSGNNEWLHWRWNLDMPPEDRVKSLLAKSKGFLFMTWTVRRLRHHYASRDLSAPKFEASFGCLNPRVVGDEKKPIWNRARENYLKYFRHNLEQIMIYAKEKETPVILCEVPYRLDLCPGYFLDQPQESYEQYQKALGLSNPFEKMEALRKSRELMCGNLGPMPKVNEVIAQTAGQHDAIFVALQNKLENMLADPANFNKFFLDFCHLTDIGHQRIAEEIVPAIQKALARREAP